MTVITNLDTADAHSTEAQASDARIAQALRTLASDAAVLRLKVQALRWDYTGPRRRAVTDLLAEREAELTRLFDTVAARLRALGHPVPGGPGAYRRHASITFDDVAGAQDARLRGLREDLVGLIAGCRRAHAMAAPGDPHTAERLAAQIRDLERGIWMLSAQLANG